MLSGRVCLVTGGSRGIGRGITLQLGRAGAVVYVTNRNQADLQKCADEVKQEATGGKIIPVVVDHSKDSEVKDLFARIANEQNGKLDVLVNNAYSAVKFIFENMGKKFYDVDPVDSWDCVNNVGLRNHYICTTLAAKMMVAQRSGLIVNISSLGGLRYLFNVSYGIGKAAMDRMAADCAHELKGDNVAVVSLWPGPVKTELITDNILENPDAHNVSKKLFEDGESTEFSGKAVMHLAADPNVMVKSGRILLTADLAREYGFTDYDGLVHGEMRSVSSLLRLYGYTNLAQVVPGFVRVPCWVMHFISYKF